MYFSGKSREGSRLMLVTYIRIFEYTRKGRMLMRRIQCPSNLVMYVAEAMLKIVS